MKRTWTFHSMVLFVAVVVALSSLGSASAAVTVKQKVGDNEYKFLLYGFSQMELRGGDGMSSEGGMFFKAQRIRLGTKYFYGGWFAKLFLDFNQPWDMGKTGKKDPGEAGLPKAIKDAFVGYKWNKGAFIRMGMIKMPHGMGFTIPGWNLDNIERSGLDKALVMERGFGLMLSGRFIGGDAKKLPNGTEMGHEKVGKGFGYDVGIFNTAGRSAAVTWDYSQRGDVLAYAMRVHYDNGKPLHLEASYAVSQDAAGGYFSKSNPYSEDYKSFDFGVHSMILDDTLDLKLEYIQGTNVKGVDGWDQDCWVGTAGYMFTPQIEGIFKYYMANSEINGESTDRDNIYLGVNFFISPLKNARRTLQGHRIQINYVLGDDNDWNGVKSGYSCDGWMMQWQYKF